MVNPPSAFWKLTTAKKSPSLFYGYYSANIEQSTRGELYLFHNGVIVEFFNLL